MGTKTNAKRLRPSTKRQKRKPPMSKRVKTAIRTNMMDEKPIDEIKPPRAITRGGGDALTNFRAELSSTKLDEMDVYFKKINKDIGVGAFAKRALKPGMLLANVRGKFGNKLSEACATKNHSSVNVFDDETGKTKRCVELTGTLSVFNHACLNHANCTTRFTDSENDYKVVQTVKNIRKNEEMTILYDLECDLKCRKCK